MNGMKKYRVFGHTTVTVSTVIKVSDDEELDAEEIYARASDSFEGIDAFAGNGGLDKLIGVHSGTDSISADEEVEFDDFMREEDQDD